MSKICENLNFKAMDHLINLLAELEYCSIFMKQNYTLVLALTHCPIFVWQVIDSITRCPVLSP